VIALFPEASVQLAALERFYIGKQRPQALRKLNHSLAEASLIIVNSPDRGLPAPLPYPGLVSLGLSWLKRGRYWVAYDPIIPIIAGIFFETDDIPNRV
jgi:hypothetical protein